MKTKLHLVLLTVLSMYLFISCEKNEPVADTQQNEMNLKSSTIIVVLDNGHAYLKEVETGRKIHVAYYMRTFFTAESSVGSYMEAGGCYGYAGSCLPDADVYAGLAPIVTDKDDFMEADLNYEVITNEMANEITRTYADPLRKAMSQGNDAVREFFFNEMYPKTEFPEQLIEDFKAGKLTVKEFPEGLFIVNSDAKQYDDTPDYNW